MAYFDVFQRRFHVGLEVGMFEFPRLCRSVVSISTNSNEVVRRERTNMFSVRMRSIFSIVLDLVEIVLVELTNKTGEVAVLEMQR